jgi:hypothetical protein
MCSLSFVWYLCWCGAQVADNRKVAVVTGATRGTGLAIARALAGVPRVSHLPHISIKRSVV